MRRIFLTAFLLFVTGAMGAQAEERQGSESNPHQLDDSIVVTANRKPTPIREIGSSVTVITPDQSGSDHQGSVADLLRSVPGVDVAQSGGRDKATAVFMRGANSHHTLVLIDGVEMNDPSASNGAFDFAGLDAANIERIEILRGSQSVLYGSDAIGGVIQIFTKSGSSSRPELEISAEAGSFGTFNESLRLHGLNRRVDYSILIGRQDSDGFSSSVSTTGSDELDGYETTELAGQVGLDLGHKYGLRLHARQMNNRSAIDGSDGILDDPNYTNEATSRSYKLRLHSTDSERRFRPSVEFTYLDHDYSALNLPDEDHPVDQSEYEAEGTRWKVSTSNVFEISRGYSGIFGIEREEEEYSSSYHSDGSWGPYEDLVDPRSVATSTVYLLNELRFGNSLFFTAGGRVDDHERFNQVSTWRVTGAWLIPELNLKLKGNAGTGFKAPSLLQILHPLWGNPNLNPERSRSWELGCELTPGGSNLTLDLIYFQNRFKQLIVTNSSGLVDNVNRARSRGVELEVGHQSGSVDILARYSYTRTENLSDDAPIVRRPESKLDLRARMQLSKPISLSVRGRFTGERFDINWTDYSGETVTLDKYWLFDLGAGYQFSDRIQFRGQVRNLFDKEYTEIYSYATPGRTVSVGASLRL